MLFSSYTELPSKFYQEIAPTKVKDPKLIVFNHDLAKELGLENLSSKSPEELSLYFSGNELLPGSHPIAQAYAGHQFGHFAGPLGDGRACLLGECKDKQGSTKDIQLKGSGPTYYSRGGDGRAWLGPVLREYIVSEAMHALGVPSTRALCAVSSGENIFREHDLSGAILTRVASSHIRVGTFEFFAAQNDYQAIDLLFEYCCNRHFPELNNLKAEQKYLKFFAAVADRQLNLICKWMSVAFVHGVMNTDNTLICGETIDYGPCAFVDYFDYHQVFSSIDHGGRYSYSNQANICLWNLSCLANTLVLGACDKYSLDKKKIAEQFSEILEQKRDILEAKVSQSFISKLGLSKFNETNQLLIQNFLSLLHNHKADFSLAFRYLSAHVQATEISKDFASLFDNNNQALIKLADWHKQWQQELKAESLEPKELVQKLDSINPYFIPRNFWIEQMIEKAHEEDDFELFHDMLRCLKQPFEKIQDLTELYYPPQSKDETYTTYCGT